MLITSQSWLHRCNDDGDDEDDDDNIVVIRSSKQSGLQAHFNEIICTYEIFVSILVKWARFGHTGRLNLTSGFEPAVKI